jgi:hypothetical protein
VSTRIAYVISAYKYPDQLERLVRRLSTPTASFWIHVDRKTRAPVFQAMVDQTKDVPNLRFLPRHVCHWGGFGHVRASLKGISEAIERNVPFDYLVLLTGQDYPLRSATEIEDHLGEAGGLSFMNHWRLPHAPWGKRGGLERLEDWHFVTFFRLHIALPLRRRLPGGLVPYGGGAYWCFSRRLVEYVNDFVAANPGYVRFFEHALIPDEHFFQIIVLNSELRDTVVNDNLRYIDWSEVPGPTVLRIEHLPQVLESGKLFARKFDAGVDAQILDALDRHVSEGR